MTGKKDRASGIKSAYELAIERLESQGIERPGHLDEGTRQQIAEVRSKTEADLAKLEILHGDRMRALADPQEARRAQDEYAIDRRRLEERRDGAIAKLRDG